jgi:hypothetical protein
VSAFCELGRSLSLAAAMLLLLKSTPTFSICAALPSLDAAVGFVWWTELISLSVSDKSDGTIFTSQTPDDSASGSGPDSRLSCCVFQSDAYRPPAQTYPEILKLI